jgi:hypothetical protein
VTAAEAAKFYFCCLFYIRFFGTLTIETNCNHLCKAILREQNRRGKILGAGRRVQSGAQPDEASNRLTRRPAAYNRPLIRAHDFTQPRQWRIDGELNEADQLAAGEAHGEAFGLAAMLA